MLSHLLAEARPLVSPRQVVAILLVSPQAALEGHSRIKCDSPVWISKTAISSDTV